MFIFNFPVLSFYFSLLHVASIIMGGRSIKEKWCLMWTILFEKINLETLLLVPHYLSYRYAVNFSEFVLFNNANGYLVSLCYWS